MKGVKGMTGPPGYQETQNPEPQTLDPEPETLNPKPETLNPKP